MIKVFGRISSGNVQKVFWCCDELGLDVVHEPAYGGDYGGLDDPAYLALNPNGLVPTLIHDNLVLWESHTIVRYLAATFGAGSIWPVDAKARALSERWMDWSQTSLDEAYFPAFMQLIRTSEKQRDQKTIEASVAATTRLLTILDDALGASGFVAGDDPTLGGIALGPTLHRWLNLPCPMSNPGTNGPWRVRGL
jgi:glutathione S-transferase